MSELATAYVSLVVETKDLASGVSKQFGQIEADADKAGKSAGGKFSGSLGGAVKGIAGMLGGVMAGIGVKNFLGDALGEARESQKVGAITESIIKSTGGAAQVTAQQVGELAAAISRKTGIDDEAIQASANLLLTFKNVKNEAGEGANVFDRATAAAQDMSAAGFGDAEGAAKMLGKALNDPIKGITALGRAGVTFTEAQKKQIEGMVESGDVLGAQKIIMAEVESQIGGAAEASATAGDKAAVAMGNLKETIGTALLPVVDRMATFFTDKVAPAIEGFVAGIQNGTGFGGKLRDIINEITGGITAFTAAWKYNDGEVTSSGFPGMMERLGYAARQTFDYFTGTVWPFMVKFQDVLIPLGAGILAIVAAMKIWHAATVAYTAVQAALNAVMSANPIGIIVLAIVGLVAALVVAYKNSETFRDIVNGAWAAVKSAIGGVVDWITGTAWPAIKGAWDSISGGASALWEKVKAAWESIKGGIDSVVSWLTGTAWPAVKGVFDGIGSVVSWLWDTIISPYFNLILGLWTSVFSWLADTGWPLVKGAFDAIGDGARILWDSFIKPAFDAIKGGIEVVVDAFGKAKDAIGAAWSGLKDAISGPIQAALSWISSNFIDPLNRLLEKVGIDFRLPTFSTGGAVGRSTAGGVMLAAGGRVPGYSPNDTADNIPAWLTAGEYVLPVGATRSLRARFGDGFLEALRRGLPGYAGGGLVDSIKGAASGAWDLVKMAADALKDPAGVVAKIVSAVVPGGGIFPEVASGVLKRVIDAIVGKIRDFAASLTSAGVDGGSGGPAAARVLGALLPGLTITSSYRDAERNAAVGGRAGSLHMDKANPALDIGGPTSLLDQMYKILVGMGGWRELLWRVAGHYDHIHVAAQGGLVPPFVADSGVTLAPGLNLLNNRLGRPEPLARTDQGFGDIHVHLEVEDLRALRTVEDFVAMVGVRSRMQAGVR